MLFLSISSLVTNHGLRTACCEFHHVVNPAGDGDHPSLAGWPFIEHKAITAVAPKYHVPPVSISLENQQIFRNFLGPGWKTQKNSEALLIGVMAT